MRPDRDLDDLLAEIADRLKDQAGRLADLEAQENPSGPGGADPDAIHDNVSGEIAAIAEKASPVSGDLLLIEDSAAGNAKKKVQVGNLPGGGSGDMLKATYDTDNDGKVNEAEAVPWSGITGKPSKFEVEIQKSGSVQGTRSAINFIPGTNVTLTVADNAGAGRVDVTVSASSTTASGIVGIDMALFGLLGWE